MTITSVYTFSTNFAVFAETEDEAREHLIGELNNLLESDNEVLGYTYPGEASEVMEAFKE